MKCFTRLLTLFAVFLLTSAFVPSGPAADVVYPTGGWEVSTPEAQGVSSEELLAFIQPFTQENFRSDSLVIARNGYIIAEAYNAPFTADRTHHLMSTSKSIVALAVGIALQEGLIDSLDEPMTSFFPERTIQNLDARKRAITLEHLLTMSAGFACDDMFVPLPDWTIWTLDHTDDPLQAMLDLPMAAEPGTSWAYCNLETRVVAAIVNNVSGMPTLDYIAEKLFAPLGITDFSWVTHTPGVVDGHSGLYLNTRDMAKLGYLLLQRGKWEDEQILPADYVDAMIGPAMQTPWTGAPYGYLIWTADDSSVASAVGHAGQFIVVSPNNDLVLALTGSLTELYRIMVQSFPLSFGVPAIEAAGGALPENNQAANVLQAYLDSFSNPVPSAIPEMPATAEAISGKTYTLLSPNLFYPGPATRNIYEHLLSSPDLSTKAIALRFGGVATTMISVWIPEVGRMAEVKAAKTEYVWIPEVGRVATVAVQETDTATLALTFADDTTLDVAVGLDNVYRVSPWRQGEIAAKGLWLTPDTFRIYLRPLGSGMMHRLDMEFVSFAIDITAYEFAEGEAEGIQGMNLQ